MEDLADQFREKARQTGFKNQLEEWRSFCSNVSDTERQQVMLALLKDNPWIWRETLDDFLFNHDIELCLPVLDSIVEKTGFGINLPRFLKRCSDDLKFADQCIAHLKTVGSENSCSFSSIILAHRLTGDDNRWMILHEGIANSSALSRRNFLFASRVLINMGVMPSLDFVKAVNELGTTETDTRVNKEIIWIVVLTYNAMPDTARDTLTRFMGSNNLALFPEMLAALTYANDIPAPLRFSILETLSEIEDRNLEDQIGWCISRFGHINVSASMRILKKIAQRNNYFITGTQRWIFEQLGEREIDKCLESIRSWVKETLPSAERYKLHHFFLPDAIVELTSKNRNRLTALVEELSQSNSNDDLVIAIIQEYIKTIPRERWIPKNPDDDRRLNQCIAVLKNIASRSGKSPSRFPRTKVKLFQCGQLIELIRSAEPKPRAKMVKEGLKAFANIKRFISVSGSVDFENLRPTPLFVLLGMDRCSYDDYLKRLQEAGREANQNRQRMLAYRAGDALSRFGILSHLDNCLAHIVETEPGTQELRAKLLHEEEAQFQSALSEIEVVGRLRPRLQLTISGAAPVSGLARVPKRPDIDTNVLGLPIHIEVITPGLISVLRYLGGGGIPNRLVGMVLDEFEKHLKELTDDSDAVIVVDMTHSEMDYMSADSAMGGSPTFEIILDKKSGQIVAEHMARGKDAVSIIEPATRKILGLIVYKRIYTKEGHVALRGKVVPNPFSTNVKKELVCKIIQNGLLDIID